MKLNLGCGDDIRSGWHNVDIEDRPAVDQQYNLEDTPWPWATDSAEYILLDNVLEHLAPPTRPVVIDECHRVLHADGTFEVCLPAPYIGGGWDMSHYSVPAWNWYEHPEQRDRWRLITIETGRYGIGNFMPGRMARWLTRKGLVRCVSGVRAKLTVAESYKEQEQ